MAAPSEVGEVHAAPHEQEMAQMPVGTLSAAAFDPSAYETNTAKSSRSGSPPSLPAARHHSAVAAVQ
ncbi:hypothetical protein SAMN05216215_108610 [Saccharopolyspora shandongensis]|uniref:Uncharacterized protein n=1 Tax=Saccharopolyspora shandongensis TaxID=418495 RepID=A0A1H3TLG6_9PSEU|nr:hypothetical protein [Saccharopolyspora shandongensis]SDZ50718.1 hypothetical protein SAMN05216215_108610 [Saccharopolyspora shandongensis]